MLLIGELKAITADASGAKFRIKHMPDWLLAARQGAPARFAEELRLRNTHEGVRLILIATIARNENDAPAILELDLVPAMEWIPVTSEPGLQLLRRLIKGRRRFTWAPCEDAITQSRHTDGSHAPDRRTERADPGAKGRCRSVAHPQS
jgi:hypothetical protein